MPLARDFTVAKAKRSRAWFGMTFLAPELPWWMIDFFRYVSTLHLVDRGPAHLRLVMSGRDWTIQAPDACKRRNRFGYRRRAVA